MTREKLSFHDIFYIFLFGCLLGWIVEGLWTLLKKGLLINHSALVIGPFNLVYGLGAIVLTLALYNIKDCNAIKIFGVSFVVGTILEYAISLFMEYVFGFVAWTYKHKPYNINGRVCLSYSIFWGILGIFWIKFIFPKVKKLITKLNKTESAKFIKIAITFLIFDSILTIGAINRGKEYEQNIPPSNKIEEVIDKYFGVEYLNNMFNNRWNRK